MEKKQKPAHSKKEIKKLLENKIIAALEVIVTSADKKIKKLIKKSAKALADTFHEHKAKPSEKKKKSVIPAVKKTVKKIPVKKAGSKKSSVKKPSKK